MASQGPFLVGTGANVSQALIPWSNPTRIQVEGEGTPNADVVLDGGGGSDWLSGTNCGFTIPGGATIDGIVVELNDWTETGAISADMYLTKNGAASVGSPVPLASGAGWVSYGGATSLWGTTWTLAEINASTFGAFMQGGETDLGAGSVTVDAVRITVHYTDAGGAAAPQMLLTGVGA